MRTTTFKSLYASALTNSSACRNPHAKHNLPQTNRNLTHRAVVPEGVRHNPVADAECHLMLIERKTTLHTGNVATEKTRSLAEQLRAV